MNRIAYLDSLRAFACIAVILFHVSGRCGYSLEVSSCQQIIMNVYHSLSLWCVPVFVMISGALFLNPDKKFSVRKMFTRNILRIVAAFAFWSFVYALYSFVISDDPNRVNGFFVQLMRGHFHMWFLFLITGLYLLIPAIKLIVKDKRITEYFLFCTIILNYALPFTLELMEVVLPVLQPLVEIMKNNLKSLHFADTASFICYFVLGHYLHTTNFSKRMSDLVIMLDIIVCIFIALAKCNVSNTSFVVFYHFNSLLVLLQSVSVFLFAKAYIKDVGPVLSSFSRFSFGIYLVHMFVLYSVIDLGFTPITINPIMGIPLMTVFVLFISFVLITILSRVNVLNRWVI